VRIYDTLTGSNVELVTRDPEEVAIYVCGPTVQAAPHVGHGRSAVAFDVVRRYLMWRGYRVTFVRNITDVEDKIIAAATETGEPAAELAARMAGRFAAAFADLGILEPDVEPKATEHVPEMLDLINRLIEKGIAYPAGGDVYFSVRAFERYGRLSGQRPDDLISGTRVDPSEAKNDPVDFALWKGTKPGEPWWDSPWGRGRPGWHIECSAMAARYLGEAFDIHGGGSDLIFPHHENEIAQSEAAGGTFARYWMHNGMVNLGGEKMAKSTGLVVDLEQVIHRYGGMAVRLFYLRAHYRSPLEYSEQLLADAAETYRRLGALRRRMPEPSAPDAGIMDRFRDAMDDDFGTPQAVAVLFDSLREANRMLDSDQDAGPVLGAIAEIAGVLGLTGEDRGLEDLREAVGELAVQWGEEANAEPAANLTALLARRSSARKERDFASSDAIRDQLAGLGIVVEDSVDGPRWFRR
jgi:cysteinyl-tRNA synthetase